IVLGGKEKQMPVIYLDVPPAIPANAKNKLFKEAYDALHEALPIPDTRVLLREYPLENVSQDGRLDPESMRPIISIDSPAIPLEHKRKLVRRLTAAMLEAYRLPKEDVRLPSGKTVSTNWVLILFREYSLEQASLDHLMASENPMVLEAMQAAQRSH